MDLGRITPLLSRFSSALKDAGLQGIAAGNFLLSGNWNKPLDWDFQMDAHGNPVLVKNRIRLDQFEIQIRLKNRILNIPYLHATPYQGTFGAQAFFNLSK